MYIMKRHTLYSIKNTELVFRRLFIPSQIKRFEMFHRGAVLMYSVIESKYVCLEMYQLKCVTYRY